MVCHPDALTEYRPHSPNETPAPVAAGGATSFVEQPQNGWAGLKHWRYDLVAGFLVALISTPFSIGIAVASGAPPITGLTSAIVAGFVLPFFGGSYVTISGPAAGLAPALYTAMLALGTGNLAVGYPLLLPVILLAGIFQLILSACRAARFAAVFPVPVVEGMLASIGLMIMAKQLPTLVGHQFVAHEFWGLISEAPHELLTANPTVLSLGLGALAMLIGLSQVAKHVRWVSLISPQLITVILGTLIAIPLGLQASAFIHLPDNPLAHGITWPNFSGLLANEHLWLSALTIAVALTLIDGIESLATITAIDKIDPYHRKSDPDKTLFAMGVSNICSSLVGGLTIIPGGVKSTANILAGGRTQWANFFNACFLLLFLVAFHKPLQALPLAVLAAVLVFTGYKLCRPAVWINTWRAGWEQFALFGVTVFITLTADLMWGILGGVSAALILNLGMLGWAALQQPKHSSKHNRSPFALAAWVLRHAFQSPIAGTTQNDSHYRIIFNSPLVCFNYIPVLRCLEQVPKELTQVALVFTPSVLLIDHTIMDNLTHWQRQFEAETGAKVIWEGLETLHPLAQAEQATRWQLTPAHPAALPS